MEKTHIVAFRKILTQSVFQVGKAKNSEGVEFCARWRCSPYQWANGSWADDFTYKVFKGQRDALLTRGLVTEAFEASVAGLPIERTTRMFLEPLLKLLGL